MKNTQNYTEDFISKIDDFFKHSENLSKQEGASLLYGSSGYGVALWANFIKDYTVPRKLRNLDPEKWHQERCAFYTKPDLHIICLTAIFLGILRHDGSDGRYSKKINVSASKLQQKILRMFEYKEILENDLLKEEHPEYLSYLKNINNNPINKPEYQVIRAVGYLAKRFGITPIEFDRVMYLYGSFNFSGLNNSDELKKINGAESRYIDLSKFLRDSDQNNSLWSNTKKLVIEKIANHRRYDYPKGRPRLNLPHLIEYVYYDYHSYRRGLEHDNRVNEANLYQHYIHNRYASGAKIKTSVRDCYLKHKDAVSKLLKENILPGEKVIRILEKLYLLARDQNENPDLINSLEYDFLLAIFKNSQNEDSRKSLQVFYEKHKQQSLTNSSGIESGETPSFEIALGEAKKYKEWLDKFSDGKSKPNHPIWGREFDRPSAGLSLAGNLVHFFEIYNQEFGNHDSLYRFLIEA